MKLIDSIKEENKVFKIKYEQGDKQFLVESEKIFIRHLNWIDSIIAEYTYNKKLFSEFNGKRKLKAKELREKNALQLQIKLVENDLDFLHQDVNFVKNIMLESSKLIWEEYSKRLSLSHTFDEILDNEKNLKYYYRNGILDTYKLRFVPKVLSEDIRKAFPEHPKDEFTEARALKRQFFIHEGGTNSGKTYLSIKRLMEAENGLYLAPLRLLALEIFDKLNSVNVPCSLKTGEEEIIVEGANHIASTVEKVDLSRDYEVAVIDEAQMLSDPDRGAAWTRAILGVRAKEVHICCALHATDIVKTLVQNCEDSFEIVTHKRDTELTVESNDFRFSSSVREGDALIVFSRKSVLAAAAALEEKNISCSLIYGSLPPETRRLQFKKFLDKESSVLVSTDAIGMGVNLPIRRIVFLEMDKFDGEKVRPLLTSEIKQIAGRAGRKGIYEEGFVNSLYSESKKFITNSLICYENPINKVFISPTEDILKVDGELETLLKVWASIDTPEDFYEKINIDRYISLITIIKQMNLYKKLEKADIFRAINMPFDETESELLYLWKDYLKLLAEGNNCVYKPDCPSEELLKLEIYYRKINLYYSFSKSFNLEMDESWLTGERSRIANLIDRHLKESIQKFRRHCKSCGMLLPWNYKYDICDSCYNSGYSDYVDFDSEAFELNSFNK
ncbi:helicase-related protein [Clostridium oryzae]|uniref:RNA helicase n=1 Tax=Clostridium oryzae TaxID=1450648 RepID=A0A1V4IYR0_9CLOT|nr:helicase-related protein [Clostridium oryzae]OPJ65033.1 ski2-like helicase [Clostridium oryzae]